MIPATLTIYIDPADLPAGTGGGAPGAAATVAVGTVTSLAPGATPTVTNSGTSSAAVLNFGIPQGAAGTNTTTTVNTGGSAYSTRPKIYRADMANSAFKAVGNTIVLRAGAQIEFNGLLVAPTADQAITIPTPQGGKDYCICIHLTGVIQAYQYPDNRPAGSVIIGGYHVLPGDPATGLDTGGGWTPTLLSWSIWDLSFRPKCQDPRGMTRIANTGKGMDIYFQGNSSCADGVSRNNDPILHGTNPPLIPADYGGNGTAKYGVTTWWVANEHLAQFGKQIPSYALLCLAAFGTNEQDGRGVHPINTGLLTDGHAGSSDPNFTSKFGLIQSTGCLWHYCADLSYFPGGTTANVDGFEAYDVTEGRGKIIMNGINGMTGILHGGQNAYTTTSGIHGFTQVSGSRSAETLEKLWDFSANIGIRGCCDWISV